MNDWNTDELVAADKRYLQHKYTVPKIRIVAKALTGKYVPSDITLLAERVFSRFSDDEAKRDAKLGAAVCFAARRHGLLTRTIANVIVLMPLFCITPSQLRQAVRAIGSASAEVCGGSEPA